MKKVLKHVLISTCLFGLFVSSIFVTANATKRAEAGSSVTVWNKTSSTIEASINRWGTGGSSSYYKIAPGKSESWGRSDYRGFVLAVKRDNKLERYIVKAGNRVDIVPMTSAGYGAQINGGSKKSELTTAIYSSSTVGTGQIKFVNKGTDICKVSVNTWESVFFSSNSTATFKVGVGKTETWSRNDNRGFIMHIDCWSGSRWIEFQKVVSIGDTFTKGI